jgi:hypothetical protein
VTALYRVLPYSPDFDSNFILGASCSSRQSAITSGYGEQASFSASLRVAAWQRGNCSHMVAVLVLLYDRGKLLSLPELYHKNKTGSPIASSSAFCLLCSGQHKAFAFAFGNSAAEFLGRIGPRAARETESRQFS